MKLNEFPAQQNAVKDEIKALTTDSMHLFRLMRRGRRPDEKRLFQR